MTKKYLLAFLASLLSLTVGAQSSTSIIEVSIGGNATEFPALSKGFLIVDTAGDGFDFIKNNSILQNKSTSKAGAKWGDDDVVIFANLQTIVFPNVGRGFNITPKEIKAFPVDKRWKAGDKLALVWFPKGSSAKGSPYSYYTSNKIDNPSGSSSFRIPNAGSVDSIVAIGVKPSSKGIIYSGSSSSKRR